MEQNEIFETVKAVVMDVLKIDGTISLGNPFY